MKSIFSSFAKLNLVLPDEFIEAPNAVSKAQMMKNNLENGLKVEIAQAEKINSIAKAEDKEAWNFYQQIILFSEGFKKCHNKIK